MKSLRVASLVGLTLALIGLAVSCRDHDVSQITGAVRSTPDDEHATGTDRCVPGQTFQCMGGCGDALTGYQVCAADGRSYGVCMCPPLRAYTGLPSFPNRYDGEVRVFPGAPLLGGSGNGGQSAATGDALVGAACRSDRDCGGELGCLTADGQTLSLGGPAGGYCTTGCSGDASCQSIDRGARCVGVGGQNLCVRTCASRVSPAGVSKCLDREDVMCVSVAARGEEEPQNQPQAGLCLPACQSDRQCGPGLFCDLGNGFCSRTPPVGGPVGSSCVGADSCASGICLTLSDRFEGFCSGFCRMGAPGCGFDGSQTTQEAACVLAQVPGEGDGDRGLCLEVCQTAADCREPGSSCIPTAAGSLTRVCVVSTGAPPVTPPATTPDGGPPAEPRTGNACSQSSDCGAGLTCLTADSDPFGLGAGIPGGYCSASCSGGGCPEPGSVCVTTSPGGDGFCLRACNPSAGSDCGSRASLVCTPFGNDPDPTSGFCFPQCITDGDCQQGVCDATGTCVPDSGGGTGGTGGQDPEPPAEPSTGNACEVDDDCGTGTCLSSDQDPFGIGGGLPGGYCSAACGAGNSPCSDPDTVCVTVGAGTSLCLRACQPSAGGDCGERDALVCIPFGRDPTRGFCIPGCSGGDECGERVCDVASGLCVDAPDPECAEDEDCGQGQVCVTPPGQCSPAEPECLDDSDCLEGEECEAQTLTCIDLEQRECEQDSQCTAGVCDTVLGLCVDTPPGCTSDAECGAQVCDVPQGICVDPPSGCSTDAECGVQICDVNAGICVAPPPAGCSSDAECGSQICDLSSGQCVAPPPPQACTLDEDCSEGVCDTSVASCIAAPAVPVGGTCTQDTECAGDFCLQLDATSFCTGACLLGTAVGCEAYGTNSFCLFPVDEAQGFGLCLGLCNTAADCPGAGDECLSINGELNGRTGACVPAPLLAP